MGRVTIPTLLPIDSWAKIMGVNPFEFNQIGEGFPKVGTNQCQSVWFQYQWQKDFVSREEIAQAIDEAEAAIARELGFWPAPKQFIDEPVSLSPGQPMRQQLGGGNAWGWWKSSPVRWGHFVGGGLLNRTEIDPSVVVSLHDYDGDGIEEVFSITFATSITNPNEIGLYFTSADRNAEELNETWRLRPVKVVISGGNATVTGHPSLLVIPNLTTVIDAVALNVLDPIYVTDVAVYRVWLDSTHTTDDPYQGVAVWDAPDDCSDGDCQIQVLPVCLGERSGRVYASYGGVESWPQCYQANRFLLNYQAGYPLRDGQMAQEMAVIVAHLATALLPSEKCGCERSNRIIHHWRTKPNEGDQGRSFTQAEIDSNPFVERNGALWAWKRIKPMIETGVVSV